MLIKIQLQFFNTKSNFVSHSCPLSSSAQPDSVTIHPVNATSVSIQWSPHQYLSTTLQYTSYFTATGAVMSHYDTVLLPNMATTEVSLDDTVEGYGHNFTLHYNIACDDTAVPVTMATYDFGKCPKHCFHCSNPFHLYNIYWMILYR